MKAPRRLDWPGLMETGLGRLRLSPADFWSMTPREFRAACRGAFGEAARPADAGALRALMARFPDGRATTREEDGS